MVGNFIAYSTRTARTHLGLCNLNRAFYFHGHILHYLGENEGPNQTARSTVLLTSFRKSFFAWRLHRRSKYANFCHAVMKNHMS